MAALVAHEDERPARIVYNKDDDMRVTGKRHPFQNDYRVGVRRATARSPRCASSSTPTAALADLSAAVLARAMMHADNAYYIPNVRDHRHGLPHEPPAEHRLPRLRRTAGRRSTIENIIEEIAAVPRQATRSTSAARNCYGIDDRNATPYGQIVANNTLPRLFDELDAALRLPRARGRPSTRSTRRRRRSSAASRCTAGEVRHLVQHEVPEPGQRAGEHLPRRHACRCRPARRRWARA